MWEPRRLSTLWASAACYKDSFTFFKIQNTSVEVVELRAENRRPYLNTNEVEEKRMMRKNKKLEDDGKEIREDKE
jgi:hypothetical protein